MIENRGAGVVCGVACMFVSIALPEAAQAGFFEQFFGGSAEPQSSIGADQPQSRPHFRRQIHRVMRTFSDKPILQTPTDIMHDPTLRPGDAVMMKSGIKVFTGHRSVSHDQNDFTPLDEVRHIKPRERIALALLDIKHDNPLTKLRLPASGRSSFVARPIVVNVEDIDEIHRTIRFVGP